MNIKPEGPGVYRLRLLDGTIAVFEVLDSKTVRVFEEGSETKREVSTEEARAFYERFCKEDKAKRIT